MSFKDREKERHSNVVRSIISQEEPSVNSDVNQGEKRPKKIRCTINITEDKWKEFKHVAYMERVSMSEIIEILIDDYIENYNKNNKE